MTFAEFKRKWHRYQGKETSAYQEHFTDLCRLLGQKTPNEADPSGTYFFCYLSTSAAGRKIRCPAKTVGRVRRQLDTNGFAFRVLRTLACLVPGLGWLPPAKST